MDEKRHKGGTKHGGMHNGYQKTPTSITRKIKSFIRNNILFGNHLGPHNNIKILIFFYSNQNVRFSKVLLIVFYLTVFSLKSKNSKIKTFFFHF